ncbi:MAG: hypothetical protein IPM08_12630 [Actinomycetales bacterium]|nr:hypothetical protein [Actinomycetales bacterium]
MTGLVVAGFLLASAALLWVFNVDLGWRTASFMAAVSAVPLLWSYPSTAGSTNSKPNRPAISGSPSSGGALCAPLGALLLNTAFHTMLLMSGVSNPDSAAAVLSAPPVEEGLKGWRCCSCC